MDLLHDLNEPQRAAVLHTGGPLLIFAGAGSGKTRTLTRRIARLVLEEGVQAARILAVTFTNKAAKEMRERLDHLVGKEAKYLWMGTFHALCAQMLRIHGEHIGLPPRFAIFDGDDQMRVVKDVLREMDLDADRNPPARMLGQISDWKNSLLSPEEAASKAASPPQKTAARVYAHYTKRLAAAQALDFDDLLMQAVRLLRESQASREFWSEKFLHILVDEFQDVNKAQFEWTKMLASKHRNICVVGDDDQCVAAGEMVQVLGGERPIEEIAAGDVVTGGAGRGTTMAAAVSKVRAKFYEGPLLEVKTRGGRSMRVTPNHMCFARLGSRADVHYVYLAQQQDGSFEIGVSEAANFAPPGCDKAWVLRVHPSREGAEADCGILRVVGAGRLLESLGLSERHPHFRADEMQRRAIRMTAFGDSELTGGKYFGHAITLDAATASTWGTPEASRDLGRTALLAEKIARAAAVDEEAADIAHWAALSTGDKFALMPTAHLHPTMAVPVLEGGRVVEDEIESVQSVEFVGTVHDLDVAGAHNYAVGGILVHNSIYAWRGADVKIILDFESQYPDAQVVRLEENYRSSQNILDAAHGVISKNLGRKPKRLWTRAGSGRKVLLHGAANAQEEALWVVRQIELLRRERKGKLADFAILCRVNAQSRPFEEAFLRARVPLKLVGTQRFYDRKEIRDVVSYLKVLYNPNDSLALSRIINVPARGIGATTVEKLRSIADESGLSLYETIFHCGSEVLGRAIDVKLEGLRSVLRALEQDAKEAQTVVELIEQVLRRTHYLESLRSEKEQRGTDRVANIEEFTAAAGDFDGRMEAESWGEAAPPEGPPYLGLFLESSALDNAADKGADAEDAVTLMTLHSAKGLEFPVVFMPGMEDGLLPHGRALRSDSPNQDELEEERRLCYVGMTRAQDQLILSYAAQRMTHGRTDSTQPSQFLDEVPGIYMEKSGLAAGGSLRSASTRWDAPERQRYGPKATTGNTPVASTSSPKSSEPLKFAVGDKVRHPSFGEGVVVNTSPGGGAGEWAEVAFLSSEVGKKKLAVSFAPLEKA